MRSIGQPDRPRTRYCSIGFQPVSSVHGTEARQGRPFVPTGKNTRSSGLEVLKGDRSDRRSSTSRENKKEQAGTAGLPYRLISQRSQSVDLPCPFSTSNPEDGIFHQGHKGSCLVSSGPVDARYRLEAYATLTGARSRWLPDWTLLQQLHTRGTGVWTHDSKGLCRGHRARGTVPHVKTLNWTIAPWET